MTRVITFDLPETAADTPVEREAISLVINGKDTGHKVYSPTIEQISFFSRVASKMATPVDKLAGIFRFLESVTDQDSYEYIVGRFEDPRDPLNLEWLTDFVVGMSDLGQEEIAQEQSSQASVPRAARREQNKTTKTTTPVGP